MGEKIKCLPSGIRICPGCHEKSSHREAVGVEILRALASCELDLCASNVRQDGAQGTLGHPILQAKRVSNLAFIAVAPEMMLACGVEEPKDHTQTPTCLCNSAEKAVAGTALPQGPLRAS